MRTKDPELMKQILEYIEDYYIDHNASPSTTRIAEQMGIGRGTVHKYLVEMDERGMLSYQGRKITDGTDGEDAYIDFQGGSRGRYIMWSSQYRRRAYRRVCIPSGVYVRKRRVLYPSCAW